MAAGRKPKPTSQKILEGNPGKRPLNRNEPQFSGEVTCPKHLNKIAKSEWKRVSKELSAQGLLTTVDRSTLAAYCTNYARWVEAEENLAKPNTKLVYVTKSGYPLPNPFIAVAKTAMDQMHKFAIEFGFTPSSRSRLSVSEPAKSEDPFTDFMNSIGGNEVNLNDKESEHIRAKS